jgi:hypothetical protein
MPAKVLPASSPLARRGGGAAASKWSGMAAFEKPKGSLDGARAMSAKGTEAATAIAVFARAPEGRAEGDRDAADAAQRSSGDKFVRRSKQGGGGSKGGGRGMLREWLVLGETQDVLPISRSPLAAGAAVALSPTLPSPAARRPATGAPQIPRTGTHDSTNLLDALPTRGQWSGAKSSLGLAHGAGAGAGWRHALHNARDGASTRAKPSLVPSNSGEFLLKRQLPGERLSGGGFGVSLPAAAERPVPSRTPSTSLRSMRR